MNSIYRTTLNLESHQVLSLTGPPISALGSRTDTDKIDLWYEHMEDEAWHHDYNLHVAITGGGVPWTNALERSVFRHLGTFIALDGYHVGHVYVGAYNREVVTPEFQRMWEMATEDIRNHWGAK